MEAVLTVTCKMQCFFSSKQDYKTKKASVHNVGDSFHFCAMPFSVKTIHEDTRSFLPPEWSVWRLSKVIRIDSGSDINEIFFSCALT